MGIKNKLSNEQLDQIRQIVHEWYVLDLQEEPEEEGTKVLETKVLDVTTDDLWVEATIQTIGGDLHKVEFCIHDWWIEDYIKEPQNTEFYLECISDIGGAPIRDQANQSK